MRKAVVCLAVVASTTAGTLADPSPAAPSGEGLFAPGRTYLVPLIDHWRSETWRWQRLMGKPRTPSSFSPRTSRNLPYRQWVLQLWKKRAQRARELASSPPRLRNWLCIFRHERHPRQGWRTNTGNGFYGGLQMNIAFQRRYASWLLRQKGTTNGRRSSRSGSPSADALSRAGTRGRTPRGAAA